MHLFQWNMYCNLWWTSSHRGLLELREHPSPLPWGKPPLSQCIQVFASNVDQGRWIDARKGDRVLMELMLQKNHLTSTHEKPIPAPGSTLFLPSLFLPPSIHALTYGCWGSAVSAFTWPLLLIVCNGDQAALYGASHCVLAENMLHRWTLWAVTLLGEGVVLNFQGREVVSHLELFSCACQIAENPF